jgi:hypothetical protein
LKPNDVGVTNTVCLQLHGVDCGVSVGVGVRTGGDVGMDVAVAVGGSVEVGVRVIVIVTVGVWVALEVVGDTFEPRKAKGLLAWLRCISNIPPNTRTEIASNTSAMRLTEKVAVPIRFQGIRSQFFASVKIKVPIPIKEPIRPRMKPIQLRLSGIMADFPKVSQWPLRFLLRECTTFTAFSPTRLALAMVANAQ